MLRGLGIAASGLYAAQRALDVTGQNVANVNTEGYTRQGVVQSSSAPTLGGVALLGPGAYGTGVQVTQVRQFRDQLIDTARWAAMGKQGAATAQSSAAAQLESIIGPLDAGLGSDLDAFWNSWNALSLNPDQQSTREGVLAAAKQLATNINSASAQIDVIANQSGDRLRTSVGEVNDLAKSIGQLNQSILEVAAQGGQANDLIDQRAVAIGRLASMTGASVRANGAMLDVTINGSLLVGGSPPSILAVSGTPPTVTIGGVPATLGGEMGALGELAGPGLDDLRQRLDLIAIGLRDAVNTAHAAGKDLDGNAGAAFFTATGAKDLAVSATLTPRGVAASQSGAAADGNQALAIAGLRSSAIMGTIDAPATLSLTAVGALADLTSALGIRAAGANRMLQTATSSVDAATALRDQLGGVSVDEEMTNMLRYQRAYEAAARVVTTMDEMLDLLVNRLGTAGR
jgi:flagellar hook-associated protein 1 FlgK